METIEIMIERKWINDEKERGNRESILDYSNEKKN